MSLPQVPPRGKSHFTVPWVNTKNLWKQPEGRERVDFFFFFGEQIIYMFTAYNLCHIDKDRCAFPINFIQKAKRCLKN